MKLFILFLLTFSCTSKQDNIYTRRQIFDMAKNADPNMRLILPKSIGTAIVNCASYKPACQNGHKVEVKGLEMIALEYEKPENAKKSAVAIRGYHIKNWVFDDVRGEPILERFVKKTFNAKLVE